MRNFQQKNESSQTNYLSASIDAELDQIEKELSQLQHYLTNKRGPKYQRLVNQRMSVLKAHLQLESTIDKLQKFLSIDFLLLPQDRAIIHWTKSCLNHMVRYFRAMHEFSCKQLWVQLFLVRLGTPSQGMQSSTVPKNYMLSDTISDFSNDLMDLPTRFKTLKKTEKYLREALVAGDIKIENLTKEYHHVEIAKINCLASSSLSSRLGKTFSDASKSPMMRSLGQMLMLESATIRNPAHFDRLLVSLEDQEKRQRTLLDLCRRHAELDFPQSNIKAQKSEKVKVSRQIQKDLTSLRSAEREILHQFRDLASADAPYIHPIIVQNVTKKDNTMMGPS